MGDGYYADGYWKDGYFAAGYWGGAGTVAAPAAVAVGQIPRVAEPRIRRRWLLLYKVKKWLEAELNE